MGAGTQLIVRRSQRWFITVVWMFFAGAGVASAFLERGLESAFFGVTAVGFAIMAVRNARGGLFIDDAGVFARGMDERFRLPWGRIRGFELRPGSAPLGTGAGLYAIQHDGQARLMMRGSDAVLDGNYQRAVKRLSAELADRTH